MMSMHEELNKTEHTCSTPKNLPFLERRDAVDWHRAVERRVLHREIGFSLDLSGHPHELNIATASETCRILRRGS